jgi:hypothetical protein
VKVGYFLSIAQLLSGNSEFKISVYCCCENQF